MESRKFSHTKRLFEKEITEVFCQEGLELYGISDSVYLVAKYLTDLCVNMQYTDHVILQKCGTYIVYAEGCKGVKHSRKYSV